MSPDIIVIGGGVIGSSITYHLAKDGVRVMQIEKGSLSNQGSASRATAGGIRINNRDTRELNLAKKSIEKWSSLEDELDMDVEYVQSGQIMLYKEDVKYDFIKKQKKHDDSQGIRNKIIDEKEIANLIPSLSSNFKKAIFYPDGGHANGYLTNIAYSNAARRLGADIKIGTQVYSIESEDDTVIGVNTSEGFIASEVVINAAGAWSSKLHSTVSSKRLPLKTICHQMSASTEAPLSLLMGPSISVWDEKISLKQTIDGRIRAGGGYQTKPGRDEYHGIFNRENLEEQRKIVNNLIPESKNYEVDFTYYGAEAHSIDDIPILGKEPNKQGYVIASGFSGHGFTISPAIGETIAKISQDKKIDTSIKEFSIEREFTKKEKQSPFRIRISPG